MNAPVGVRPLVRKFDLGFCNLPGCSRDLAGSVLAARPQVSAVCCFVDVDMLPLFIQIDSMLFAL